MNENAARCTLNITAESLSAWRSQLLSVQEQGRIGEHVPTCSTCQRRLQRFERIAQALHSQTVPPSGATLWRSVQAAIATSERQNMFSTQKIFFGGLVAAVLIALFAVTIFITVGHGNRSQTGQPTASVTATAYPTSTTTDHPTATTTARPTSTATATATGTIKPDCSNFPRDTNIALTGNIPLPPGTIVGATGAAAGTYSEFVCTPDGTAASINATMNAVLTQNGWVHLTPQNEPACLQGTNASGWLKNNFIVVHWLFSFPEGRIPIQGAPAWVIQGVSATNYGC